MGMFDAPGGWQQKLLAQSRDRQALQDAEESQANPLAFLNKPMSTVLRDPNWDAYFEAMDQAGVDNVGDNSVGVKKGMFTPPTAIGTTQPGQESSIIKSNQINAPGLDALKGILKVSGGMVNDPRDLRRGGR